MRKRDIDINGTTLRRIAYSGDLDATIRMLGKDHVVGGLKPGDVVVIDAFGSPTYYTIGANGELIPETEDLS